MLGLFINPSVDGDFLGKFCVDGLYYIFSFLLTYDEIFYYLTCDGTYCFSVDFGWMDCCLPMLRSMLLLTSSYFDVSTYFYCFGIYFSFE